MTGKVGEVRPITAGSDTGGGQSIREAIKKYVSDIASPKFEELFNKVKADLEAAEARLPAGPDGEPIMLGLGDEFIEKLARKYYLETLGSAAFVDELITSVTQAVREGHGPTRRNRVALA